MDWLWLVVAISQEPRRVEAGRAPAVVPIYRVTKPGEERVEGLLQRVDCPGGRPVIFTVKLKDRIGRYQAPRLDAVEYIAHTPTFRGPMTCGGRMPGDPVYLTWKKVGTESRAVAVEFLPRK